MRNEEREAAARRAAEHIRKTFEIADDTVTARIALILGTGWGDVLTMEDAKELDLREVPGFSALGALAGHQRKLVCGTLNGVSVFALRGRIHLNEAPGDPELFKMVRLQTEMLLQLGANTLILTCAAGGLGRHFDRGNVGILDGFITLYAPDMPLWAGEFCSPEDTLDAGLVDIALKESEGLDLRAKKAGYAMVRGPFFEGRKYDKEQLERTHATLVGMSMLPEACVAALYAARVLGLAFVTNDATEEHSHETNLKRAQKASSQLGSYLQKIVTRIDASKPAASSRPPT